MRLASSPALVSRGGVERRDIRGQHWFVALSAARAWQTNVALLLIGSGLLGLTRQLISEYDHFTIGFSGVSGWSAILYLLAVFLILTQPVNRYTFPIIVTVAVACRLVAIFPDPYLSSDIYRYVWDGVVQHAHISPYRYVPGDAALSFLRAPNQDIFDNINRRETARTIYPPVAQMLFYLVTWISPTVTFMKTVMVLLEGVTLWALVALLRYAGIRREQTLLYAWCPLVVWEIAGSGHVDSAAMAFIVLALLARYRRQAVLTGLYLGVAVMLKFYPLVLFPALYRRDDWKMPVVMTAVVAAGYAAYSGVGLLVFGFLGGYVQEEGMASGARYFLLELTQRVPGLHGFSAGVYLAFCASIFAAIALLWCGKSASRGEWGFLRPAFALAAALMFLFSPHYAWYILWLVPFFTLLPNLPVLAYLLGFFYLYTTELADPGPKMFLANEILYAGVIAALLLQVVFDRWPIPRGLFVQPVSVGSVNASPVCVSEVL